MKDILFIMADLWMITACLFYGGQFIRQHGNYLLGLEMLVVGTSGTNFLLWSLLSGSEESLMYQAAYFLDAFSRSFGATLILIVGMMAVTHRYRPGLRVDVAIFALAIGAAFLLRGFHGENLQTNPTAWYVAAFYVVMNVITSLYLTLVVKQLWQAGRHLLAFGTALVTAVGTYVAFSYDFFPFSGDDDNRTLFYTLALATWGSQAFVYCHAYTALAAWRQGSGVRHPHAVASAVHSTRGHRISP